MNTIAKPQHNEKLAQFLWTAFILMFFVLQAILWTVAISRTAGDHSHAVVAGYDEQALKWDEVRKQQIDSQRLGWSATVHVSETADLFNNRIVDLELLNKDGLAVTNATLSVRAFHNSHAADVQDLDFESKASGGFTAAVNMSHSGYWRFEGTATSGSDTFLIDEKIWFEKGN